MNRAFKEAWIAALRDPSAKQGRRCLGRIDGSRCCLGVAADVAGVSKNSMEDIEVLGYAFGEDCPLWERVPTRWMGISEGEIVKLMFMNDEEEKTFPEIADWIEQNIVATDDV